MLSGPLMRTTTSVSRFPSIRRLCAAKSSAAEAGDAGAGAAACGGDKGLGSAPGRDFGMFLKAVGGIAACGSGLGLWYASTNPSAFSWFTSSFLPETLDLGVRGGDSATDSEEEASQVTEAGWQKKGRYLFGDSYRRKVFFNYEKRIRMLSSPEKVFEYFATVCTPEGDLLMTAGDLMRAVVPVFPPTESNLVREGYLRGERRPGELHCPPSEFFMLFDTNNDGLISFPEYIFFVTLLSIPESSFSVAFKMFDVDNNGEIDREEFKKVMTLMRFYNRQGVSHNDGFRRGFRASRLVEDGGLVEYFFGEDGSGRLHHDKFVQFLRDLHEEIIRLEFSHYDCKSRGTITAKDFAFSLVASADIRQLRGFLDRVELIDDCPHLRDVRITFEEFKSFADLRARLRELELALFCYGKVNGLLTKEDFQRAASSVCGVSLTDNVAEVIFHVFDVNGDRNLSSEEFLAAVRRREVELRQPASARRWLAGRSSSSLAHMLF